MPASGMVRGDDKMFVVLGVALGCSAVVAWWIGQYD
jgi:hypothetical protein